MTSSITKEFTYNNAITNNDVTTAIVNHLDNIVEIAENKRFEWEDAKNPEEYYNITFDFNEWLKVNEELQEILDIREKPDLSKVKPLNLDWNKIKDFVDGYVTDSTGIYKGQSFMFEYNRIESNDFNDVISYLKNLKDKHKTVLFNTAIFRVSMDNNTCHWNIRVKTFD